MSFKGKKHSINSRMKMSKSHKGKICSEEHKRNVSKSKTKRYARIVKDGISKGKQRYVLICDGIRIKTSVYSNNLKEHPLYKRTINLSQYKCYDCVYYMISKKCSVYERCKFTPQSCIMFNFNEKICRSI